MTLSYLVVILATSSVAFQAATPLDRFKATTDRYARMRVVSETVTGQTPASPDHVRVLLEVAIRDSDVSIRRQAFGSIASILQLNAMPVVPESQQWVIPLRDIAVALRPRLDDALEDGDASVRQEALRGIVGPAAWANPRAPLPVDLLKLLGRLFDTDPSPSIRASALTGSFTSYHAPDAEAAELAKGLLLRALEDPDPNVVQTAGWGAVESKCPEALPLLVRQLQNPSPVARMGVAAGLQAYPLEARRYLPELEAALAKEPVGPARSTLEAAITKIRNGR